MLGIVKYDKKDLIEILSGSIRTNNRSKNRNRLVGKVEEILKYDFKNKHLQILNNIQIQLHSSNCIMKVTLKY